MLRGFFPNPLVESEKPLRDRGEGKRGKKEKRRGKCPPPEINFCEREYYSGLYTNFVKFSSAGFAIRNALTHWQKELDIRRTN